MSKILLVDDDPDLRFLTEMALAESGHEIVTAADGEEALQQLQQHTFDAVLLDSLMPGIDGMEVYRWLRDNPATANTPVIFLSAQAPELGGQTGEAPYYIAKPFDPMKVAQQIEEILSEVKK